MTWSGTWLGVGHTGLGGGSEMDIDPGREREIRLREHTGLDRHCGSRLRVGRRGTGNVLQEFVVCFTV